jgi:hypothetical protein
MPNVRLVGWCGCGSSGGRDGPVGVAAVELVEGSCTVMHGWVVLPRGSAEAVVLRWGSAAVARRFASAVVAAVAARYPEAIASALGRENG